MAAYVVIQQAAGRRTRALLARQDFKRLVAEHAAQVLEATTGDDPLVPLTLAVADMARANTLAAALRELDGIATAYAKPGEALP